MRGFLAMKINIKNRKRGYASLEVIAMSLIGFTLVLALLSIAVNKRVLIENEMRVYEKRLNKDNHRNKFLAERLYIINNKQERGNIENGFDIFENEELLILDNMESQDVLDAKEKVISNNKEFLDKLSLLEIESNKFKIYLNKEENVFILEENLDESNTKIYYYDYEFRNENIYLKERRNFYVK
ncbi:MAG: hypothetical protein Q4B63_05885 [Clostridium perfringens]|nr:hypothetical protein [Clostridium perfringens]